MSENAESESAVDDEYEAWQDLQAVLEERDQEYWSEADEEDL